MSLRQYCNRTISGGNVGQWRQAHVSYVCFNRLGYKGNRLTPSHPGRVSKFGQVIWFGVPHNCQILSNWSRSEVPGKMGRRQNISPRTQLVNADE